MTQACSSLSNGYWCYLQQRCSTANFQWLSRLDLSDLDGDELDGIAFNNFAVMALIEAEQCDDLELRSMHLEMAIEALNQGAEQAHPLCVAHLALIHRMVGEIQTASQVAFSALMNTFQPLRAVKPLPLGLVYLPPETGQAAIAGDVLQHLLQASDGNAQAQMLLAEVLCRSQLAFYNASGLRFLQLAVQLLPNSCSIHLRLGLSKLNHHQWEGILHLQQARTIAPAHAPVLQALSLIYQEQPEIAEFWRETAQISCQSHFQGDCQPSDAIGTPLAQPLEWAWTRLAIESPFTYVPFDNVLLAVEPSLDSKVTSVLLAEGDWFESELEFWRDQLAPGMTVIDVGANAGVYAFSAAQRVGELGRVLAIEPFPACVRYLQETCRINQFTQVTVCAGAATDRHGTAQLALHTANELNEIVDDETARSSERPTVEVCCFTLDSLIEQEKLDRVDWLKIDAERHEMQVLLGSKQILERFSPGILYENIAGNQESNLPIAEFLRSQGYQLFRYQPYLKNLMAIDSLEDLQQSLNIIALREAATFADRLAPSHE